MADYSAKTQATSIALALIRRVSENGNAHCKAMNQKSLLHALRLPARLDVNQTAEVTGFLPHEIPLLIRARLLKPLGNPAPNGHKFFCTKDVLELSEDRDWLDKATRAVARHWRERNQEAKREKIRQWPDDTGGIRSEKIEEGSSRAVASTA